ncbi:hypothetical protein Acr_05g0004170 [Actinidia rufa]|uniref:Gnk2-homologous domain-containing protein n=1 Tax=Actinidia rufa TaxID=165716 RepID=A0A7J0EJY4_9ERIC|nr:hypothetical protein Acr_05g0004170 [Actinidia rufa]
MSWQAILSYLLLLHFPQSVLACDSYCQRQCDDTTNYTSSSIFSSNLAQALHTIRNNSGLTGFNATTAGNLTQPVTAMGLCRGSLRPSECQSCIDAAVEGVRLACPDQARGQVWYAFCMVRYSAVDFLGEVNTSVLFRMTDATNAPDLESYIPSFVFLMDSLSSIGAASDERYAIGRTKLLHNNTLYGYFECTRDLSSEDCAKCFSSATVDMKLWCVMLRVCWVLTPSCNVQVTMFPAAHADWIFAPLLINTAALAPSPNSPGGGGSGSNSNGGDSNNSGSGRGSGENDLKVMISIGALVAFLLIVGLLLASRMALKRGKVDRENAEDMMRREGIDTRPNLFDLDELAWNLEVEGRIIELVDETMGSLPVDEVTRCMRIGLLCCQECIQDRPTVSSVLSMLSSNSVSTIPPAGRPGYHQESINYEAVPEESEVDAPRNIPEVNSITHSLLLEGR